MMLNNEQLNQMRAKVEETFDLTCEILRTVLETNEAGGEEEVQVVVATYNCRLRPKVSRMIESVVADQTKAMGDWEVLLPHNTDVLSTDLFLIEERTYEIINLAPGRSDATELLVVCQRIS